MKILVYVLFLLLPTQPIFAQKTPLKINIDTKFQSNKYLGLEHKSSVPNKNAIKANIGYKFNKLSAQLAMNYAGSKKFNLDGSYIENTSGIATYGFGAVDRNWSYSKNTSLILTHNARPTKSVFIKLKDTLGYNWLPTKNNWSFELFNGFSDGSLNNESSMLLGARATLSLGKNFEFELLQTSQWGGKGYKVDLSALTAAIFADTNTSDNSNINKMSGFGFSYIIPENIIPLRVYAQAIGEDEAGNLPSCFSYLAGFEWSDISVKYPTTFNFEAIDSRVKETRHGFCGPNTMYNNNIYSYTNYGTVMGNAIDTEGTSLELFGDTQISKRVNIKYSTKLTTINDKSWHNHRLSTERQSGLINSISLSWRKNNITINGNIHHQDFSLDKANISKGFGFGLDTSVSF
jgi:hypothetical protein